MVSITVKSRSKALKELITDELTPESSTAELITLVSDSGELSPSRIRLTLLGSDGKHKPLDASKSLADNGLALDAKNVTYYAKDMGPQIGWRTVFVIEYLGPLLIHPFFYYLNIFGQDYSRTQTIAFFLVTLHFLKRELETLFVHRFSNSTMPFFNVFKNSGHYWILSGFNLSFFVYSKNFQDWRRYLFSVNDLPLPAVLFLTGLWIFAELSNLKTHIALSNLRSKDPKRYVIPKGYGFDQVACPNYFFESLSWLAYAVLVGNWSAWLFLIVSVVQMYLWAIKKNRRYLKTFGDDYKKLRRAVFIPFIL
ncbi:uncharacterized protein PRCAT00005883001 [Priceomyces carsonii]|uniref:uncharacterized protein n=1 Tax=Priceomyces carsonii TaxID=28549 RepID=UPI002EDB08EA|nr:unnamed protein product [Priceomyces carsonii]